MKRWAILIVLLYALALLLLTAPVVLAAFADWGRNNMNIKLQDVYSNWGYWLWLAVLVAGQFLLLLVPIDLSEKRLPSRRKLKVPVIVSAFFLANLFAGGVLSILCAIFTDHAGDIIDHVNPIPPTQNESSWHFAWSAITVVAIFWIIWGFIFNRFARADEPDALLKRATRWLLRGSILELLIAVPSHVIVRRRDDCCAPMGSFWGIATGISVMLLCFGPGVYFLFVERFGRLKPKAAPIGKTRWH